MGWHRKERAKQNRSISGKNDGRTRQIKVGQGSAGQARQMSKDIEIEIQDRQL